MLLHLCQKSFGHIFKSLFPDSQFYSGFAGDVVGKCPECGNDVVRGKYGYGCSNYKNGCKFRIGGIICKRVITPNHAKQLLTEGRTQKIEGFISKNEKPFSASLKMEDKKVVFDFLEIGFIPGLLSAFRQWYILQHWENLEADTQPKPFLTLITFTVPFSGTFE